MPATTSATTAQAPQKQAPMDMAARDGIVTSQPVSSALLLVNLCFPQTD